MWVPTRLLIPPQSPLQPITLTTDGATHLFLAYAPGPPHWQPRIRARRGILTQHGSVVSWPSPTCQEQTEPGDTLTHSWMIPSTTTPTPTYIAFAECCPIVPSCAATPPILVPIGGPVAGIGSIVVRRDDPETYFSFNDAIAWQSDNGGTNWPPQSYPTELISFPAGTTTFDAVLAGSFGATLGGPLFVSITNGIVHTYAVDVQTVVANVPIPYTVEALGATRTGSNFLRIKPEKLTFPFGSPFTPGGVTLTIIAYA